MSAGLLSWLPCFQRARIPLLASMLPGSRARCVRKKLGDKRDQNTQFMFTVFHHSCALFLLVVVIHIILHRKDTCTSRVQDWVVLSASMLCTIGSFWRPIVPAWCSPGFVLYSVQMFALIVWMGSMSAETGAQAPRASAAEGSWGASRVGLARYHQRQRSRAQARPSHDRPLILHGLLMRAALRDASGLRRPPTTASAKRTRPTIGGPRTEAKA